MKSKIAPLLVVTGLLLGGCERSSPPLTQEQGEQILAELQAMNARLEEMAKATAKPKPRSSRVSMQLEGGQRMGNPDAPLVLVEFFDYECGFCKRFADKTLPDLKRDYIDTGKLLYIAQDLPLHFHKQARLAAMAAHCAAEQGKFWAYRDRMVANIKQLKKADLIGYAQALGLKEAPFTACLNEERYASQVDKSSTLAKRLGVTGTPSFVLAKNTGKQISGERVAGAKPLKFFSGKIDTLLAGTARDKQAKVE